MDAHSGSKGTARSESRAAVRRGAVALLALLLGFMFIGPAAFAVHDEGVFELDGNAQASATPGDDWSGVFDGNNHSIARTFIPDPAAGDATYFKEGGSKDNNQISSWLHAPLDGTPDKDDITNAYAAAYVHSGDLLVYFGADRFSNDGDSQIGFWFFQDNVGPNVADDTFHGTHKVGDILIQSNFTVGGVISTVKVFEWVGSGGSNGSLDLLGTGGDCSTVGSNDDACALVNNATDTAPWTYVPKANVGSAGTFPIGAFYEGGINLTALLAKLDPPQKPHCFTSFLAETRTAQPFDARLKDFAAGSFPLCATKTGEKFNDLNGNGVKDPGEPGLPGWDIHLFGTDDLGQSVDLTQTTNAQGNYTFSGLEPGSYTVCEQSKAGWRQSFPSSGADCTGHGGGHGYAITLGFGDVDSGNDFGNWTPATKSGTKFDDLNANGQRDDGEPGLAGFTIYVDYNGNGVLDQGEPSDVTAADGTYEIAGIHPGTYKVRELQQAGWTCSMPSPCYYSETFTSGAHHTGNNFGNWRTATKSGTKFNDLNANGIKDAGEPGLAGVTIYVDYNDNGILDQGEPSAITDASGNYMISDVNPGTYHVREVAQQGWTCSYPSPCYHTDTFTSGAQVSNNNFGNWQPATKSGTKFNDLNADGVKDAGEPGLGGFTIYVDYNGNGVFDDGEPSAVTGADGSYTITGVHPGSFKVREVQQQGWTCSFPNPCYHSDTFTSGAQVAENDFGNWTPASKSGTKFEDLNANGRRDEGDQGVPGFTFFVDYNDNGVLDDGEPSAISDADGHYLITGIHPGTYKVLEVGQQGWVCSMPSPCSYTETFTSGALFSGNDFGNWRPARIVIVKDAIPNSPQDFTFTTTGGLTPTGFSLDDDSDPALSNQITYGNLVSGTYTVTENATTGWTLTKISCVDPSGGTSADKATAKATIDLAPGETVVCTFTNVVVQVLPEKLVKTGTDLMTWLVLGLALVLGGLGFRYLVAGEPRATD